MAVGLELLGHQVQCPTCHLIVVAPATTQQPAVFSASSDTQISFDDPAKEEEQESIFGEHVDEDLFGSRPMKIEIPVEPATESIHVAPVPGSHFAVYPPGVPQPGKAPRETSAEATVEPPPPNFELVSPPAPAVELSLGMPAAPPPEPAAEPAPVMWMPADPPAPTPALTSDQLHGREGGNSAADAATTEWVPPRHPQPWETEPTLLESAPPQDHWQPAHEGFQDEGAPIAPPRRGASQERKKGANLLLAILAPYSVIMTLVAGWYFYKSKYDSGSEHPMANIPDIFAQYEPATRKQLSGRSVKMPDVNAPLPPSLMVKLGDTLRVGDLEVTPERIEQGKVTVHTLMQDNHTNVTQLSGEALILHLRLRNRSSDIQFHPTDPVFDRLYDPRGGSSKPYNQVIVGDKHFYGGASDNNVLKIDKRIRRKHISGQDNDDKPLPPGEERQTVICTDPQDATVDAVKKYTGSDPLVWRVQLRRGLTTFRGKELSVCAVIGVKFTPADVAKARN